MFAFLEDFSNLFCNSVDAHLGLHIIGGDLRGRNHVPFLVLELLLDASIEEECDVRVFFGF